MYFTLILFYIVFTNHMHFLPVLYIHVKEEISFPKVIDDCIISFMGSVIQL